MTDAPRSKGINETARDPVLIGAVGGSGTRVVARILAQVGFFIGAHRNHAEDSVPMMDFYKTWLRSYISLRGALPCHAALSQADDFCRAIAGHRAGVGHSDRPWAVKNPRSLLMLPYWRQKFPRFRFIHVIRNGLDMAYSEDKNQLQMFQDIVLTAEELEFSLPLRAIAYWRTVNLAAADYGATILGSSYHLLRFEDLCYEPKIAIEKLAAFVETPIDLAAVISQVTPPATIDRWRAHPAAETRSLVALGSPALEHFGYRNLNLSSWSTARCAARSVE
jgi:Sulfotransferase family